VSEPPEDEVPLRCCIEVVREDPEGGCTRVRWEFPVADFDRIVANITARNGPPYFEQILSAEDLAASAEVVQHLPMGVRWGKYL